MQKSTNFERQLREPTKIVVVRRAYSVAEAATILGVGMSTLYGAIERKEIPFIKIGRRVTLPMVWVDKQVADPDSEPGSEA